MGLRRIRSRLCMFDGFARGATTQRNGKRHRPRHHELLLSISPVGPKKLGVLRNEMNGCVGGLIVAQPGRQKGEVRISHFALAQGTFGTFYGLWKRPITTALPSTCPFIAAST